ncbi:MAG: agmatinase [Acidobacteriota bacterium]
MPHLPHAFGQLAKPTEEPRIAILPLPFERTTSYGKGTSEGPAAILRASQALELYDEELESEPWLQGIETLPAFLPEAFDLETALAEIEEACLAPLQAGRFLVTLGGEHSLSQAAVRAAARTCSEAIGIVQFDAHADLRDSYDGTRYSHASVMRRLVEQGFPSLAVGVRSLSVPEASLVRQLRMPVLWGHDLPRRDLAERFADLLADLPETVYLTFDLDYFDPSLVPATGTPEPGGGLWYPTLELLRLLFENKRVVAMDVVELAPIGGLTAPDFLAAKLVYKCLGYLQQKAS